MKCLEDRTSSSCQAHYALILMTVGTAVNQFHRYLLIPAIVPMSNELEFGDKVCQINNESAVEDFIWTYGLPINSSEFCEQDGGIRCINETTFNNETLCAWYYTGNGIEYQTLAGPVFIIVLGLCGVPLTIFAEMGHLHRRNVVGLFTILWSVTIICTGLSQTLGEIYLWRFLLGAFEAPFNPFAMSMLSSLYSPAHRGIAIGLASSGAYFGYGLSYAFISVVDVIGWRWTYISTGIGGIALGVLILLTVANPKHGNEGERNWVTLNSFGDILRVLCAEPWSVLSAIFLAFACKMGYQYTTSYNLNNYFLAYYPDFRTDIYLSWILAVAGVIAYCLGGFLSDVTGKRFGPIGRLSVIVVIEIIQIPLLVAFFFLAIPANVIVAAICIAVGDGWMGIVLSAIADFVTPSIRTVIYALLFCTMDVLGGCVTVAVAPIEDVLGLRAALLWLCVGMLVGGTILIVVSIVALVFYFRRKRIEGNSVDGRDLCPSEGVEDTTKPLLSNGASTSYTDL